MTDFVWFDPLNDRIARDIRNRMARCFVKCLTPATNLDQTNKLAADLLDRHPETVYRNYITERQQRYLTAKSTITNGRIDDDFTKALVLWDNELFFETHEILESLWQGADGTTRLILQAMIRAAGFYIHLGAGNMTGAGKMAAKAVEILRKYRAEIPPFPGLDDLLRSLARQDPIPPKLL